MGAGARGRLSPRGPVGPTSGAGQSRALARARWMTFRSLSVNCSGPGFTVSLSIVPVKRNGTADGWGRRAVIVAARGGERREPDADIARSRDRQRRRIVGRRRQRGDVRCICPGAAT